MTEELRNQIDWQCEVNRLLIQNGHGQFWGARAGMLNVEEKDAGYRAYDLATTPEAFVAMVMEGRANNEPCRGACYSEFEEGSACSRHGRPAPTMMDSSCATEGLRAS